MQARLQYGLLYVTFAVLGLPTHGENVFSGSHIRVQSIHTRISLSTGSYVCKT